MAPACLSEEADLLVSPCLLCPVWSWVHSMCSVTSGWIASSCLPHPEKCAHAWIFLSLFSLLPDCGLSVLSGVWQTGEARVSEELLVCYPLLPSQRYPGVHLASLRSGICTEQFTSIFRDSWETQSCHTHSLFLPPPQQSSRAFHSRVPPSAHHPLSFGEEHDSLTPAAVCQDAPWLSDIYSFRKRKFRSLRAFVTLLELHFGGWWL